MVAVTVDRPLEQRVMDPACGSGTFLFHAVRAVLGAATAAGQTPAEAVRLAAENVAGIDIHPVAVIFARVTFLLALMPTLREGHPGNVTLPVYLGDALQWNLTRPGENNGRPDLLAGDEMLEIFVPAMKATDIISDGLPPRTLRFPATVASDPGLFDLVLDTMIQFGVRSEPTSNFKAWMNRQGSVSAADREELEKTYKLMRALQNEGRNHIWGYVARNLARPVWLASERQKADVVIGNPPWLAYRHMRGDYQERFKKEARASRVWWSGRGTSANDLSAYFFLRSALLYMRRDGRIALVMPYAALSRRAYRKFRTGEVARTGYVEFRLRFTVAWTFGPEVQPLFPVPSCVLFGHSHDGVSPAPLPAEVRAFEGTLPRRNADELEAGACLRETVELWPAEAVEEGGSPYRAAFRQGAILVPRRLVLVEPVPTTGALPPNPEVPLVRGRVGNQDKNPWKTLAPPQGAIERRFLRPALLGESVAPFRLIRPLQAIIPWDDENRELMNARMAGRRGYPRLAEWLETAEALWNEKGRGRRSFLEQYNYFGQLSSQFPIAPVRVVYTKAGTNLAAEVVRDRNAVVDHKLYWAQVRSLEEGRFLCAILNSEVLRVAVEPYQAQGQWGARDFDKYVFNLPIPRFDKDDALHRGIANAARTAERVAGDVRVTESEYFVRTRKRIRAALAEHGIAVRLEELVGDLVGRV